MHYNGNVVIHIMTELGAGKKQREMEWMAEQHKARIAAVKKSMKFYD